MSFLREFLRQGVLKDMIWFIGFMLVFGFLFIPCVVVLLKYTAWVCGIGLGTEVCE